MKTGNEELQAILGLDSEGLTPEQITTVVEEELTGQATMEDYESYIARGYSKILFDSDLKEVPSSGMVKTVTLPIGVDSGSSSYRSGIVKMKGAFVDDDVLVTPNTYALIDGDVPLNVKANSNVLYDNLEFIIRETSALNNRKPTLFHEPKHVIMGSLLEKVGATPKFQTTSSKIRQEPIYVLTMVHTALNIFIKNLSLEDKMETVNVPLGFILPPLEVEDDYIGEFKTFFKGRTFEIRMPKYDKTYQVTFTEVEDIYGESEVPFMYFLLSNPDPMKLISEYTDKNVLVVDPGHNSMDLSFYKNKVLVDFVNDTYKDGVTGNTLIQSVSRAVAKNRGGNRPRDISIYKALQTGILTDNYEEEDISEIIGKFKAEIADAMYSRIATTIQNSTYGFNEIYSIIFAGKTTNRATGEEGTKTYVAPVADMIMKRYKHENPFANTKGIVLDCDNPSLLGLLYIMRNRLRKKQKEQR